MLKAGNAKYQLSLVAVGGRGGLLVLSERDVKQSSANLSHDVEVL